MLHFAIMCGNPKSVRVLLEYGADVNAKDKDGMTALNRAMKMRNHALALLLKKAGAEDLK